MEFFVQKHTNQAEIKRRIRALAEHAVDKEELKNQLVQMVDEEIEGLNVYYILLGMENLDVAFFAEEYSNRNRI